MTQREANLVRFAIRYPGWHAYSPDRATVGDVRKVASRRIIEVDEHLKMFRLNVTDPVLELVH